MPPKLAVKRGLNNAFNGATPEEKYSGLTSANTLPRVEPRDSAKPRVKLRGKPGQRVQFDIDFVGGNKLLPILQAK